MKKYPVIKIALLFITGILVQKAFQLSLKTDLIFLSLAYSASLILFIIANKKKSFLVTIPLYFCISITGAIIFANYSNSLKAYPFEKEKYNHSTIAGKIKSIELLKEGRIVFNAEIDSVIIDSRNVILNHEFLIRVYNDSQAGLKSLYNRLNIGDRFSLKGTIQQARNERNPGEFDYRQYLFNNGISGIASAYNSDDVTFIPAANLSIGDSFNNLFHSLRKLIDNKIQYLHSEKEAALLRGLLLGDYKKIDEESLESFINAGVIHVLAVSGQHVGLIILIFFFLFNRFNPYLKYGLAAVGLIVFLFITGNQISVLRAVIMGLVFIAAVIYNRDKNMYNILALSALIILILYPNELFSPGFQLSYSAVFSIVYIYPLLKEKIEPLNIKPKYLKGIILFSAVSFSAQLGTLPFTLAYFHKLSIAALFANLIVIPFSGFIIYIGIISLVFAGLWGWAGAMFAAGNTLLCRVTVYFVDLFGKSGNSFIPINQFSFYDAVIYYIMLFALIYIITHFKNIKAGIPASVLLIASAFLFMALDNYSLAQDNKLTIIGIDVGQGDATLIKFPNGNTALIDAGNAFRNFSNGDKVILPLMDRLGIDHIDYTFITHVDADHYYGIFKLAEKGKVSLIYKPSLDSLNKADLKFEQFLTKNRCIIKHFNREMVQIGNARLYFLNSPVLYIGERRNTNSRSMILKLVYGSNSFLFTGDADKSIENKLVNYAGSFLQSDLLKMGHHGSKNSSLPGFVARVKPQFAMISAGIENRFNHPSPEVIKSLTELGIEIFRTDKSGAIIISSDGRKISNVNWKKKESRYIFDL